MITVVGSGLVGSLLAIFLSRRGHRVEMLERRPDMRKQTVGGGRSINLAVSVRGIHALAQMGLEAEILREAVPMRGRLMHSIRGDLVFQRYGKDDSECINSISRAGLNAALLSQAEKENVRIQFDRKVTPEDLDSLLREYEVVFGTDGSSSAVRQAMAKCGVTKSREMELDYGYKELVMPPGPGGTFPMEKHALHIWPRGNFMLIALPNYDGSFTCTLFLPFQGPVSFAQLVTPAAVQDFFSSQFPDAVSLIPSLTEQFFDHPTGHMVTVKCSPWNLDGKACLLGDAAHAIVPFFGQGMNAGFEDITLLDQLMARETDWKKIFSVFSLDRKIDTDAIADMAVENFEEMRDKVGQASFLMEKEVEKILQREFPGEYISRYQLVTFTRVPYRIALQAGLAQGRILRGLCHGLTSPEAVDLEGAARRIRAELAPIMKGTQ